MLLPKVSLSKKKDFFLLGIQICAHPCLKEKKMLLLSEKENDTLLVVTTSP